MVETEVPLINRRTSHIKLYVEEGGASDICVAADIVYLCFISHESSAAAAAAFFEMSD